MSKITYIKPVRWRKKTIEFLAKVTSIVEDYNKQGYRMTLRQLYYQLVSADVVANTPQQYAHLSRLLNDARLAGLVDWDFIEDRVRIPRRNSHWLNIPDLISSAVSSYRRDRWEDQNKFCEVWVEKDALSGVLSPITEKFHVTLMVNRGYSSATAMHDSAMRLRKEENNGKKVTILYVGDHDPSGEDMVRDIRGRLRIFRCNAIVKKIALTMTQIKKYQPPPNPAKMSDPRAQEYVDKHGESSWEVDALRPDVLHKLVTSEIMKIIDIKKYNDIIEVEQNEVEELQELTKNL